MKASSAAPRHANPLGVLRLENFRRYFVAQMASGAGMWNQRVAELWLLLELTGNGLSLGLGTALRTAPTLFLATAAGWLADRYDRRLLLTGTQAARGLTGIALAVIVFAGTPPVGLIYAIILVLGIINALDAPMRRSYVRDVVDEQHLRAAAGLHTATISVGRIIGPFAAGIAITLGGVGWAFLLSVASAAVAVTAVRAIVPVERGPASTPADATPAGDGGAGRPPREIRLVDVVVLLGAFSTLGWNIDVVLPLLTDGVLGQGPLAFSGLVICLSAGSLIGSVGVAGRTSSGRSFRSLIMPLLAFCITLPLVAVSTHVAAIAVALLLAGTCGGVFLAASNASLQLVADRTPDRQGRAVAAYTIVFTGTRAIGAPVIGALVDQIGVRAAIVGVSGATAVTATIAALALTYAPRST
ncbi:MAG TPA: MFS transporter [Ilumatobacter sp.]|nr:MFS transporter [Ilumatobacter sp.]